MKLLWTIEPTFTLLNTPLNHRFNALNTPIGGGDKVFIPSSAKTERDKVQISYVSVCKDTGKIILNAPPKIEVFDLPDERFYDKKNYVFKNKTIRAKMFNGKESHVIECLENGKVIWEIKHWAYLYTDIVEMDGCIIFGTDGMGSRFYCADIETGILRSETKTHFSAFYDFNGFNWHNGNIVVYGKNALTVLDPLTGKVMDEHKIPTKYLYRSFLKVINGYAYCCVLTSNNKPFILCFAL